MSDNLIFFNFVQGCFYVVANKFDDDCLAALCFNFVGNFDVLRGNWNLEYTSEFQHDIFGRVVCLLRNAVNFQ